MKRIIKYSAIILYSSLLGCVALNTDYNIGSQHANVAYAAKKKTPLNSNKSIKKYLKNQTHALNILEVNGSYTEKGNYTVQITLDADANGMNYAKDQVIQTVKILNKKSLKNFSNVGISVKADMTDGDKGYAIKSDWDPEFINSNKAKTVRLKNVDQRAKSWWQLEN